MNILITGGSGLIGQHLISSLIQTKNHITVLTRDSVKSARKLPIGVNLIESLSQKNVDNHEVIINLAGEPIAEKRWSKTQKQKICHSRWHITTQLVELIKNANTPPKVFISGSAIGMYGRQDHKKIDENFTDFHQEFTHDVCSNWEEIALEATSTTTRVAVIRTGIVLDPNGGALAKMLLPFKLGIGGKIASGQQFMSWIHIEDMVAAILHIMKTQTLSGAINITSEHAVSNQEFSKTLARTLNRPSVFTTPSFMLKALFGEMADLLLFGQNVIPQKLVSTGFTFKYPTLDATLNNLIKQQ